MTYDRRRHKYPPRRSQLIHRTSLNSPPDLHHHSSDCLAIENDTRSYLILCKMIDIYFFILIVVNINGSNLVCYSKSLLICLTSEFESNDGDTTPAIHKISRLTHGPGKWDVRQKIPVGLIRGDKPGSTRPITTLCS